MAGPSGWRPHRGVWLRGLAWAGAPLVALWILSMTLVETGQPPDINLAPLSRKLPALACLRGGCEADPNQRRLAANFLFLDVLGNIVVFVPVGAMLAVATLPRRVRRRRRFGLRWWACVVAGGFLFSLSIEIIQLFMRTRTTDIDDVIFNTLGALLGAVLVRALFAIIEVFHD